MNATTMKIGSVHVVGFGKAMMNPFKLLELVVEFAGKATFTAVLGSTADGVQRVETIVIAGYGFRLTFSK